MVYTLSQTEVQLSSEKAENDHTLEYYRQLKELDVDMTKYLVHLQPIYKPEKEIFVGPSSNYQTDLQMFCFYIVVYVAFPIVTVVIIQLEMMSHSLDI